MRECKKCNTPVPYKVIIDNRERNLKNRKYCLQCSPFGQHNTQKLELPSIPKSQRVVKNVAKRRKKVRDDAIAFLGGKCERCGYDTCSRALCFHHRNPEEKEFNISNVGKSWASVVKELKKCILLCHNCHMELHDNLWSIEDIRREAHKDEHSPDKGKEVSSNLTPPTNR